jgi:cellulose biosynthesis protein BcsQ
MSANDPLGRILTFYSYKGGTGRSMALANIAWVLASAGRRVLVIDWDLEAPGLHRYFRPFLIDEELTSSEGLMDLVDNYANQAIRPVPLDTTPNPDWYLEYADFSDYIVSVNFPHFYTGGRLDFLPAGRQGDHYAIAVSSFNWQNFYDRLGGGGFFEAVKNNARKRYDYVLIDSRTGVSDTAGICSVQMPDALVVCFTYNNQSIKGAAAVARSAVKMRDKMVEEKLASQRLNATPDSAAVIEEATRPFLVFPVPMRVDAGESDRLALRQVFARDSFSDLVAHIGPDAIGEYWKSVEVPHAVFYSYEEVLAPFKDDAHDPKTVLAAFLRLTRYITDGDVADFQLPISPAQKQEYLDMFAETPLTAKARQALADSRRESEEEALVRAAETALASLTVDERSVARRVFGRLVRLGRDEEGGGYFPIRANLTDFSAHERAVVTKLASHRIVTITSDVKASDTSRGGQTVTLADARLLHAWRPLLGWIESDREFLLWRQRLRAYLGDWERAGRDHGALLSGRLLSEADLWSVRRESDLNKDEVAYIQSSREAAAAMASATPPLGTPVPRARVQSPEPRTASNDPEDMVPASPSRSAPMPPDALARAATIAGWLWGVGGFIALAAVLGLWALTMGPSTGGVNETSTTTTAATNSASTPTTAGTSSVTVSVPPINTSEVDALVAQGDGFLLSGNTAGALTAYTRALTLDPNNRRAYAGLARAREADQSTKGRIFLQYTDSADQKLVAELRASLSDTLKPLQVSRPELVNIRTNGEVRYFFSEDEKLAARVKDATEFALARIDYKVALRLAYRDAANYPKAQQGTVEVWLPALERSRYGQRAK